MSIDRIIDGISAEFDLWWRRDIGVRFELPTTIDREWQQRRDEIHRMAVEDGALCVRDDCKVCGPAMTFSNQIDPWTTTSAADVMADLKTMCDKVTRQFGPPQVGEEVAPGVFFIREATGGLGSKLWRVSCGAVEYYVDPTDIRLPHQYTGGVYDVSVAHEVPGPLHESCRCGNAIRRPGTWDAPMEIRDAAGNHWKHHPDGCSHTKTFYLPGNLDKVSISGMIKLDATQETDTRCGNAWGEPCYGTGLSQQDCPKHGKGAPPTGPGKCECGSAACGSSAHSDWCPAR